MIKYPTSLLCALSLALVSIATICMEHPYPDEIPLLEEKAGSTDHHTQNVDQVNQSVVSTVLKLVQHSKNVSEDIAKQRIEHAMIGDIEHKTDFLNAAFASQDEPFKKTALDHWFDALLRLARGSRSDFSAAQNSIRKIPSAYHPAILHHLFENEEANTVFSPWNPLCSFFNGLMGCTKESRLIAYHTSIFACDTPANTSGDHQINIYDLTSGSLLKTLGGHKSEICYLTFNKDKTLLASLDEKMIKIWNVETGLLEQQYNLETWKSRSWQVCLKFNSQNILHFWHEKDNVTKNIAINCATKNLTVYGSETELPAPHDYGCNRFPSQGLTLLQALFTYHRKKKNGKYAAEWNEELYSAMLEIPKHFYVLDPLFNPENYNTSKCCTIL